MSFTLSYIAKVALVLELIDDMIDLTYFGYEQMRFFYNLAGTILWTVIVQNVFDNNFLGWLIIISVFIFRTTFIISKKKFMDEQNEESDKK